MKKNLVFLGDRTSHDGKVITATSTISYDGRKAAVVGDLVSCPRHGDNPIIEGGEGFKDEGRQLVVDGCRTRCGCVVIAGECGMSLA